MLAVSHGAAVAGLFCPHQRARGRRRAGALSRRSSAGRSPGHWSPARSPAGPHGPRCRTAEKSCGVTHFRVRRHGRIRPSPPVAVPADAPAPAPCPPAGNDRKPRSPCDRLIVTARAEQLNREHAQGDHRQDHDHCRGRSPRLSHSFRRSRHAVDGCPDGATRGPRGGCRARLRSPRPSPGPSPSRPRPRSGRTRPLVSGRSQ